MPYLCNNKKCIIMKRVLFLLLVLCSLAVSAQYRYKNLTVNASSSNGEVTYPDDCHIDLDDSLVSIRAFFDNKTILSLTIENKSDSEIKVKWPDILISNEVNKFYARVDKSTINPYPKENTITIYSGDKIRFMMDNGLISTFSAKKQGQEVIVCVPIVIGSKLKKYMISLKANIDK